MLIIQIMFMLTPSPSNPQMVKFSLLVFLLMILSCVLFRSTLFLFASQFSASFVTNDQPLFILIALPNENMNFKYDYVFLLSLND